MKHIDLLSTNGDGSRLIPVRAFIAARLSPFDLNLITGLKDHKGDLEVYVIRDHFDYAVSVGGKEYLDYFTSNIADAWLICSEHNVKLIYDDNEEVFHQIS